jgi:uncharacterized protein YqjF (DUF2071 family)
MPSAPFATPEDGAGAEPVSADPPALRGPVLMNQEWLDLTFLHWAVAPDRVAHLMPRGVRPDVRTDATGRQVTYVGLVPFRMRHAAPFRLPGVPWLGTFLETNVRLYSVDRHGVRGVVFLSLDCERVVVTAGARLAFGTPYRWARMRHHVDRRDGGPRHTYTARLRPPWPPRTSRVVVQVGDRRQATDLDHFVSARWGLHTSVLGLPLYVPNEHPAWPLHDAELVELDDELLGSHGLADLAERPPDHLAFSPGVRTVFGMPRRLGPRR